MNPVMVPWWGAALSLLIGALIGGLLVRYLGTGWLAMLAWVLDFCDDDVKAIAKLAWETPGLIPEEWKRLRFANSEEKFATWVGKQVDALTSVVGKLEEKAQEQGATNLRRGGA